MVITTFISHKKTMSLGTIHKVAQTSTLPSASVIFLHGSGDTGQGLLNWVKFLVGDFTFPHINFYFPTAPLRPYTPLHGELSNVWFDRYNITPDVPEHKDTLQSIGDEIKLLVNDIVRSGIPRNRIVIGGFSMGGALALHSAYRFTPGVAGVFTLSSFLNEESILFKEAKNLNTPLYMCHGDRDTLVPISWGRKTHSDLIKLGVNAEFITINNTLHELKENEILGLFKWIETTLPQLETDDK